MRRHHPTCITPLETAHSRPACDQDLRAMLLISLRPQGTILAKL